MDTWNPQNIDLLRAEFARRRNRSWLDRAIAALVVPLLARGWLRWKLVPNPNATAYMLRVYLSPGGTQKNPHSVFAVFLHYLFTRDDPVRGLHAHPYPWFLAWILTAGYVEVRRRAGAKASGRWYAPGSFNWLRSDTYHRVTDLGADGVWTLFVCGPRVKESPGWGFLADDETTRPAQNDGVEGIAGDWIP